MIGTAEQVAIWLMRQDTSGKQFEIKEHREKRSLDSNAYYWVLAAKLAKKLHISTARLHNIMLRRCAPPFIIDGRTAMQPIPDTERAENQVLESETFHLKPTDGVLTGNDGMTYRWYVILRGSSTFDSTEMNVLISHMVEECRGQGIEVATPTELAEMAALWEKRHARKDEKDSDTDVSKAQGLGT